MWCSKSTELKFSANHSLCIWYNFTWVCVYAWVLVKTADAKPTNREDQLYQPPHGNLSIWGFWYPWALLEPIPPRYWEMTIWQFIVCTQMRGNQANLGKVRSEKRLQEVLLEFILPGFALFQVRVLFSLFSH